MVAFDLKLCRFSHKECFNPKNRRCVNGGGTACAKWRKLTDVDLFGKSGAEKLWRRE